METQEIWKAVVGYEGKYEVSNLGNVMSLNYGCTGKGRLLSLCNSNNGYKVVNLSSKTFSVHRLVATAFIENPYNKPQVNHINGIKGDNHLENLEFVTHSENAFHAYRNGLKKVTKNYTFFTNHPSKGKFGLESRFSKPVLQFNKEGIFIREFSSTMDVYRELGINHSSIALCCRGEGKTAYGFIWKYNTEQIRDKVQQNADILPKINENIEKLGNRIVQELKPKEAKIINQ